MSSPRRFIETCLARATATSGDFASRVPLVSVYDRIKVVNGISGAIQNSGNPDVPRLLLQEAQSSLLTSLLSMSFGQKRSALIHLRCAIEEILLFLYFSDHPHEYKLWEKSHFKPIIKDIFSALRNYNRHVLGDPLNRFVDALHFEYEHLCSSVHASSGFTVNDSSDPIDLQSADRQDLVEWAKSARNVCKSIALLTYAKYYDIFEGGKHLGLKSGIQNTVPNDDIMLMTNIGFHII